MQRLCSILSRALDVRRDWLSAFAEEGTDCYRLLHGAVEGAPGVAVDRYGPMLLVQTWRQPLPDGALDRLVALGSAAVGHDLIGVWNHRVRPVDFARWHPIALPEVVIGREGGLTYDVRPRHRGQDPLLFLDIRCVRRRLAASAPASVLNLFAYTCGVGLAAAAGGARSVLNVDFARSAMAVGRDNARRNGLEAVQRFVVEDCFCVSRQLASLPLGRGARRGRFVRIDPATFDLVVLDPPRWSTSRFGTVDLIRDYPSVFKPAVRCVAPGGQIVATNHVPSVDRDAWIDILRRCAAKAGRPLAEVEILTPEADFPSPDGRPPLKIAWCRVE